MTAPELKPCPFCGGEATTSPSVVDRQVLYAHCKDHTCPGWTVSRCPPVRWNRRADLAAVQPAQDTTWDQHLAECHCPQPDPRDAVIARLVEAVDALEMWDAARGYPVPYRIRDPLRTALAAAKAVQHG